MIKLCGRTVYLSEASREGWRTFARELRQTTFGKPPLRSPMEDLVLEVLVVFNCSLGEEECLRGKAPPPHGT